MCYKPIRAVNKKLFPLADTSNYVTFLPTMYPIIICRKTVKPVESLREILAFIRYNEIKKKEYVYAIIFS